MQKRLSLGELGSAAGTFEAILLTLFHSRVAGQQAGLLQRGTKRLVILQKGASQTVTDCAGLTGHTAAGYAADNVKLAIG